eukprot:CAMPEP_0113717728 /NCGR_PEP_ID=MMETSP0038_2-20120614/34739_1 /TAXON_ID=2898 /ORGANISM="Cryptomonas paramecium" /LENGTH=63 /DNA_ID=CAMNT_0000645659 /DNA_START=297 /DNA_END=485 /DNA_ORIENTATION=+ /assembly_acc=CAM_ASM_000170
MNRHVNMHPKECEIITITLIIGMNIVNPPKNDTELIEMHAKLNDRAALRENLAESIWSEVYCE